MVRWGYLLAAKVGEKQREITAIGLLGAIVILSVAKDLSIKKDRYFSSDPSLCSG